MHVQESRCGARMPRLGFSVLTGCMQLRSGPTAIQLVAWGWRIYHAPYVLCALCAMRTRAAEVRCIGGQQMRAASGWACSSATRAWNYGPGVHLSNLCLLGHELRLVAADMPLLTAQGGRVRGVLRCAASCAPRDGSFVRG